MFRLNLMTFPFFFLLLPEVNVTDEESIASVFVVSIVPTTTLEGYC